MRPCACTHAAAAQLPAPYRNNTQTLLHIADSRWHRAFVALALPDRAFIIAVFVVVAIARFVSPIVNPDTLGG